MDTILHNETSFLGKFYIHQENNAPFMIKNSIFFPWKLLGLSKKTLTYSIHFPHLRAAGRYISNSSYCFRWNHKQFL